MGFCVDVCSQRVIERGKLSVPGQQERVVSSEEESKLYEVEAHFLP